MNPKPLNTGYLSELDGHRVYFAQYGNVSGPAIIVCHGGPGDKSKPKHVSGYDLSKYHVIIFDQRGCGGSTPLGEVGHNTTQELVSDMERIRNKLKINKWFVAGGSWGSTLALLYAETHPETVKGLLLSSIFLARLRDEKWAFSQANGIDRIFPDLWDGREKLLQKYETNATDAPKLLLAKIEAGEEVNEIVAGVMNWEGNLMTSQSDLSFTDPADVNEENIASVKVFLSYEANKFYIEDDQILNNISNIKNIPTIIVHGRYDLLCPVEQAWEVKNNLTNVETIILPSSNHRFTAEGLLARKFAINYFLYRHIQSGQSNNE